MSGGGGVEKGRWGWETFCGVRRGAETAQWGAPTAGEGGETGLVGAALMGKGTARPDAEGLMPGTHVMKRPGHRKSSLTAAYRE